MQVVSRCCRFHAFSNSVNHDTYFFKSPKVLNQWQKRAYKAVKYNICSDIARPDLNQYIGYKKGLELEF
jgi:hypothetical protein